MFIASSTAFVVIRVVNKNAKNAKPCKTVQNRAKFRAKFRAPHSKYI